VAGVFVGLGSNMEEPMRQLTIARTHLSEHPQLGLSATSRVYLSSPQGPKNQPDFYNAVVQIHSALTPFALLDALHEIEEKMGRIRTRRWGERCIDLDLLLFDNLILQSDNLKIPHPRAHERRFVLDPLIELLGEQHKFPGKSSLGRLLSRCSEQAISVLCEFPE